MEVILTSPDDEAELEDIDYDEYPVPEKSTVLCQIIEGDSYLFRRYENDRLVEVGLEFGEIQYEGGSAEIEAEIGMLEDAIAPILEDGYWKPGWFVVEGFYGFYSTDYWGDVDCDFSFDKVREAKWSDIDHFGVMKTPLYVKILNWFGVDPYVKRSVS